MRYFIPEWDDRVDSEYDFLSDQHSKTHIENPFNDHYMWDVFPLEEVPFAGVLVSRAKLEENRRKLEAAFKDGIRKFLRLPTPFAVMGDCGAWSYIEKDAPPYDPVEIVEYYSKLGVDLGVTVDHLVVTKFAEQKQRRMQITYENGLKGYDAWRKNYKHNFKLLAAVQGWNIQDYIKMYLDYYSHGIRNFGFGGLARSPNSFIKALIKELTKAINTEKAMPEQIHFFGLGRIPVFMHFQRLEELGIEISFDTASWLRRAWLSGINYYTVDDELDGYKAIRIPQMGRRTGLRGKKRLGPDVDADLLRKMEQESLSKLRAYDQGRVEIQSVMEALHQYGQLTGIGRDLESHYLKTLTDMPWKKCDCPICKSVGVEVMIFRGNNRNRRRGFHNTYIIYHKVIKNPELWPRLVEEKPQEPTEIGPEELKNLTGKVLVIAECTKEKIGYDASTTAKAKDLYQGLIFKTARRYAESRGFDYLIISAKYGLLCPDREIEGYEKVLRTKADVEAIRENVEQKLRPILPSYDKVLVIGGARYREVLRNLWDDRFVTVKSRGYGDLCSIVMKSFDKSLLEY